MSQAVSQTERSLKRQSVRERRKYPRFDASDIPVLKSASQVGGTEVKLINISRSGALIESSERMESGSSISLRLITEVAIFLLKGRIVRSSKSSKQNNIFQSAIAFDEDFTMLPESINLLEEDDLME
jgi:hypothetical protein